MNKAFLAATAAMLPMALAAPAWAEHHEEAEAQAAPALTAPEIEFTEWTLDNGLRVIAIEDDSTGTVTTSLWYEIGSKLDPEGRSGFAHLFEHILSRKTRNMPYNMIYDLTADVGGTRNASNGTDRTNYYETVPAQYLEAMLWTHRERMAFPVVDDDVFETERAVVKEEYRTRVLAPPYGLLSRVVLPELAYDDLPHRRPGIGSMEDLDAATLADARAFHQAYYGPDTATLIIAGNFDMGELRSLVDEYFADIPRRMNPVDVTIDTREDRRTSPRSVTVAAPNTPLPMVGTVWQLPEAMHPDAPAIEVLNAIMARGENSRFHTALVKTGIAVEAAQFANLTEEGGMLAQYAITNPQADQQQVATTLSAETARVREEMVSAAELAEAKNELISDSLRQRETARGRAFELGEALVSTGDPRAADTRLAAIAAVTAEDVQRVAREWLDPQARVDMVYTRGEFDPSSFANPEPMPTFRTLPPAVGEPLEVLPEGEREAPPGPGEAPDVAPPAFETASTSNGITVIAAKTSDVPIATMTVLFPGGSAADSRDLSGAADMAAALATKGTSTRSAEEIAARMESLGASIGGSARSDGTLYSLTAPVQNMAAAGEVFADVIRNASYPQAEFERERARALDGLQVSLNEPGSLAGMVLRPVLYGDAPYGSITGGTPVSLAALTREDLLEHRQTYWHPEVMQIVASGGIAPEEALSLAESMFGDWTVAAPAPAPIDSPAGAPEAPRTVVIDMPDAGQAAVLLAGRGPERTSEGYFPLLLANAVLGGGSSGRLFEEIRTNRGLSYGAYSGLGSLREDPVLQASSQTANETVPEVVEVMLNEFARIGTEPLSDDLLDRRRLYLQGGYARSLESSSGFNGIVADLLTLGLDPSEVSRYAESLETVDAAAASAAAGQYFDPANISVIVVGNASAFIDELRAVRPNVEVIPASELDLFDPQAPVMGG
ncbi:M16 family metallopeptidase [Aurantiacibacter odishensis]|uniref:M16 family metallopeptidase n=1 Tax=Aurantiacibacter odishensis TaxID=1155476 RepID=UPI000E71EF2D|nr:pitrilysin family protein [Aurantiacibacter odishensis]